MSTIALPQLRGSNLLTHSRMQANKTCPRKHWFRYELGVRPDTSGKPLRMGRAYQLGLEARDNGEPVDKAVEIATRDYEALPSWASTEEAIHAWLIERETVARLLESYYWRWAVVDDAKNSSDPLGVEKVIAAEVPFEIAIRNPETGKPTTNFKLAGKIDAIVRLMDGRMAVKENKTTSDDLSPESDYWKRLRIDQQISTYYIAARELGHDITTVIYDATRKPAISPCQIPLVDADGVKIVLDSKGERVRTKDGKKWRETGDAGQGYTLQSRIETPHEFGERLTLDITEEPDRYFARMEIPRLDADLDDFRWELWQQQQQLRESQKAGRWFRNTSACVGFGKCEYFDVCTNAIDVMNTTPTGMVRVDDIHPELSQGDSL